MLHNRKARLKIIEEVLWNSTMIRCGWRLVKHDLKLYRTLSKQHFQMRLFYIILLVYISTTALSCTTGTSRLTTASANTPASNSRVLVSSSAADSLESALTSGEDGGLYVVSVEHQGKDADVFVRHLNQNGEPEGEPVRVNPERGSATAWRGDPPTIVVSKDETIYVGWTKRVESSTGHASDVYVSASRDRGKTFDAPVKVNDDTRPAVHGMHSLYLANDGRLYVAWLDERNIVEPQGSSMAEGHHMESNREVFISSSPDGGRSFTPNIRVATDACPCCKTSLAGSARRLYVGWRQVLPGDYRHIAVASSVDNGKTFSKSVIVSDDQWVLKGCPVSGAALSADSNDNLRVLWYAGSEKEKTGIYFSESKDGGQSFAPRQLLWAGVAKGTPILTSDKEGETTALWESSEAGGARVYVAHIPEAGKLNQAASVANGELPSTTSISGQTFITFTTKDASHSNVWLVKTDATR